MNYKETSTDPMTHAANIKRMLGELIEHAREDVSKVNEPKFQALLETTAEVLIGLKTAFEHYETKKEPAMA
jgi:hypothetical protein